MTKPIHKPPATAQQLTAMLLDIQREATDKLTKTRTPDELEQVRAAYLGKQGELTALMGQITAIPTSQRREIGKVINTVKNHIVQQVAHRQSTLRTRTVAQDWIDVTMPGIQPPHGTLHIVSQAIAEIEEIFKHIGFTRVHHPEVDTDYYAFEALNMPLGHPARDEWETFFIKVKSQKSKVKNKKNNINLPSVVLTPHTSNGQVREMERIRRLHQQKRVNSPAIRMINIARCYRRQSDISHTPMFHQFEGLHVDTNVSIVHLKGVLDYFARSFFGRSRKTRIRPFHFQFTEPSFEVDVSCDICTGTGTVNKTRCRLCKEGWLELGGAGMVHPRVLENGGYDPAKFTGFAFGWGVERTYMMKEGMKIDDIRLLYSNDVRFLEQF